MKRTPLIYVLVATVITLLVFFGSGFYWSSPASAVSLSGKKNSPSPSAAIFVPKQAPVMASLLVNPDRLSSLSQFLDKRSRNQLDQFKQSLLTDTGLDYRQDVQPWLDDEVTYAVTSLDFDRNPKNGQQPGVLLIATTKNAQRSREFEQVFWQKQTSAGTDLVVEQYQGVKLIYKNQDAKVANSSRAVATAVVGDHFVLFANHPKVLRDAINNVQAGNLNLNDEPSYQLALKNLTQSRIGLSFINLPAYSINLRTQAADDSEATPNQYQSLAIALSPNRQGLSVETALIASNSQETNPPASALTQPVAALDHIPADTAFVVASTNLHQLWQQISTAVGDQGTLAKLINQPLAKVEKSWGINLSQDIFSWVDGDYALAMLPRSDREYPDWIFVTEKSPQVGSGIEHLDAVAKQQGFSVGSLPLENQNISAWTKLITTTTDNDAKKGSMVLNAQVQGVHATAGNYEIFTTTVEAMNQALKADQKSLVKSSNFKSAIAPLPQPNQGYLYLDWAGSQTFLERQFPILQVVELIAKPIFDHLRSLSITNYGSEAGIQKSQLFLQLGETK